MSGPKELFLSHSAQDRVFARRLATTLRDHGVPVWYSETSIMTAAKWHDEIGKALNRCDWLAVILSPPAVSSKWVKQELLYALQDNRYEDHIIPVLYKRCEFEKLSWTLKNIEYVDFRRNHREAHREVLKQWGIGYKGLAA